jgi:uncharacterized protein with beta-barrel porin domain
MSRCRNTTRLGLQFATTVAAAAISGPSFAACDLTAAPATYVCAGVIAAFAPIVSFPAHVTIGDAGSDKNATFTGPLQVYTGSHAITVDFATTSTPSSFTSVGEEAIMLFQQSNSAGDIRLTGMNAVVTGTIGSRGIGVYADTSGITTIETVAGGTITADRGGIYYSNAHLTPGAATITVGAAITANPDRSAVEVLTRGSSTLNINADLVGGIISYGFDTGTVEINIGAGANISSTASSIQISHQASATITNNGTITGSASQVAIFTSSNTTVTNTTSGTVTANATGFAFTQAASGRTLTVNNAGTLTGTGESVAGTTVAITNAGTWKPNRNSDFQGTATLANSGTFNSGAFTTALSSVTNSGTVNVQAGGTLNTSGSYNQSAGTTAIAMGSTLVATGGYSQSGGTTTVNGTLASAVTLSGGTLGGSGTINGNLIANAGAMLSPGNSVGTLTVSGNATFNAGSTYRAEIIGGASDLLSVGGTASLAGTLQLVAGGGSYSFNAPYTVLTAAGGRNGTFDTVSNGGSFGVGVTSEVSYGNNDVKVTLKPGSLVDAGSNPEPTPPAPTTPAPTTPSQSHTEPSTAEQTPSPGNPPPPPSPNPVYNTASGLSLNTWSVAAAIDRAVANGADPSFLYQIYARGDRQALIAALSTLTGEVHASVDMIGWEAAGGFLRAMLDPFATGRDPNAMPGAAGAFATAGSYASTGAQAELPAAKGARIAPQFVPDRLYNLWGQGFGSKSRSGADIARGSHASDASSGHLALGIDFRVLPDTILGVAIAAGESRSSLSGALGETRADILQAGLYGLTRIGALSLGASLGYASAEVETSRAIPLIGAFAIRGQYRAEIWSGRAEAAWRLASFGGLSASPYAAFTAQNLRTPGFIERDGVTGLPAGLAVQSRDGTTARTELGLRLDATTSLFGLSATAFGKLGWGYYARRDNQFSASLIGLPGSGFGFQGTRPDRNTALVATGLDVRLSNAVSLGARFNAELSQNTQSYAGAATLKVSF